MKRSEIVRTILAALMGACLVLPSFAVNPDPDCESKLDVKRRPCGNLAVWQSYPKCDCVCPNTADPGDGKIMDESIDARFGVGRADPSDPSAMGVLRIYSQYPDDKVFSPIGLEMSNSESPVELVYDGDAISQVLAPQTFVVVDNVQAGIGYDLVFYLPSAASGPFGGPYQVVVGSEKIAIWEIRNEGSIGTFTDISFTKKQEIVNTDGSIILQEIDSALFSWDEQSKKLDLIKGNIKERVSVCEVLRNGTIVGGSGAATFLMTPVEASTISNLHGYPNIQLSGEKTLTDYKWAIRGDYVGTTSYYLCALNNQSNAVADEPIMRVKFKEWIHLDDNGSEVAVDKQQVSFYDLTISPETDGRLVMQTADDCTMQVWYQDPSKKYDGKIKAKVFRDGSWIYYEYDEEGRIKKEKRSWLNNADIRYGIPADSLCQTKVFDYEPIAGQGDEASLNDDSPRKIEKYIENKLVSRTWHVYSTVAQGEHAGAEKHIEVRAASKDAVFNDLMNARTMDIVMRSDSFGDKRNLPYLEVTDNDTATQYNYHDDNGYLIKTAINGVYDWGDEEFSSEVGSMKSVIKLNKMRSPLTMEQFVCIADNNWLSLGMSEYEYDDFNRLERKINPDTTEEITTWSTCCAKESVTYADGRVVSYAPDANKRVKTKTEKGFSSTAGVHQITTYDYNALGQVVKETMSWGTENAVTAEKEYTGGRLVKETDRLGRVTRYGEGENFSTVEHYDANNTLLSAVQTTHYNDAQHFQTWEWSGSLNAAGQPVYDRLVRTYEYDVDPSSGETITTIYEGEHSMATPSLRTSSVTRDFLGRVVETKKAGFNGDIETVNEYNSKGQLEIITSTGKPKTKLEYSALGRQKKRIIDSDGDDLFGGVDDKITEFNVAYIADGDELCRETKTYVWRDGDTNNGTLISKLRARLNNLGGSAGAPTQLPSAKLIYESKSYSNPNEQTAQPTISRTWLDASTATTITITEIPTSAADITRKTVNGLAVSQTDQFGATTATTYDAQRRPTTRTHAAGSRTNESKTFYNELGQVVRTEDNMSIPTWYVYDEQGRRYATVRVRSMEGIELRDEEGVIKVPQVTISTLSTYVNDSTHYAVVASQFDDHGHVIAQWGSTYPVAYEYNDFGQMTKMWTLYNNGGSSLDLFSSTDPRAAIQAEAEKAETEWIYDPASGLLTQKKYADGKGPTYTYTTAGKLKTRTWARTAADGSPLTTTYNYNNAGLCTGILYGCPNTPDVTFTYNRNGQQETAANSNAQYQYFYDRDSGRLSGEYATIDGVQYTFDRRGADDYGRSLGYCLFSDTVLQDVDYAYDTFGRLESVSGDGTVFTYKYLPEMNVNSGYYLGTQGQSLETFRKFEDDRMLIDKIENRWGPETSPASGNNIISAFDYTNDAAGRRTARTDSGSAFTSGPQSNTFVYDIKSQVEGAVMGEIKGANQNVTHSLTSAYEYDELGNRTSSSEAFVDPIEPNYSKSWGYTPTDLNQYSDIKLATQSLTTPQYDFDGNSLCIPSMENLGEGMQCGWNGENRLIAITNGNVKLEFAYDYMGRRIRKTVYERASSAVPFDHVPSKELAFLYDGWNMIREIGFEVETYGIGLDGVAQDGQWSRPTAWSLKDGGVQLTGNAWKKIPLDVTLTADAALEFDVFITDAGEITGIGFDDNNIWNDAPSGERRFFKIAGTQELWEHWDTEEGSWVHRSVNVGQYLTGDMTHLILLVDDDADGSANAAFRNIRVTTGGKTCKIGESSYLWGLDLSGSLKGAGGVGGLLAVEKDGQNFCPTYDANGNVSEYLAQDGSLAAHYEYGPFGNRNDGFSDIVNFAHRFSSKFLDSETSLYYYGYRYYLSEQGRWINRDPICEYGGENIFAFHGNNLIDDIDVLGKAAYGEWGSWQSKTFTIPLPVPVNCKCGEPKTVSVEGSIELSLSLGLLGNLGTEKLEMSGELGIAAGVAVTVTIVCDLEGRGDRVTTWEPTITLNYEERRKTTRISIPGDPYMIVGIPGRDNVRYVTKKQYRNIQLTPDVKLVSDYGNCLSCELEEEPPPKLGPYL